MKRSHEEWEWECEESRRFNAMFSGVSLVSLLQQPAVLQYPQGSCLARQRRQRLSEKTRCLERLVPWDNKMDMATLLHHTYNYVRFLRAQLTALSTMPTPLHLHPHPHLSRLSRSQLLHVLVNSPVAQTILSSNACCVFSVDHLSLLHTTITPSNFLFLLHP